MFFQNGSWEYGNLTGEGKYTDDDLAMIPIYIGVGDEANQGLCTGTENYWCVNKEASEDDIQATLDFINWCVTSEEGTKAMADDMGFVIPFKAAQESPNLFVKQDAEMTAAGKTPVSWNFTTMPSEEWKNVRWLRADRLCRRHRQLGRRCLRLRGRLGQRVPRWPTA